MKRRIYFAIIIFTILSGRITAQNVPKLRIDPEKAFGGNISQYFSNIEYIPLETSKESLFGTIDQLIITDSSYVVNDNHDTHSVLFFSLGGKFVKKIKETNPNTSIRIKEMPFNSSICISTYYYDQSIWENKIYTKSGLLITKETATKSNNEIIPLGKNCFAEFNSCYITRNRKQIDSTIYLVKVYEGNNLRRNFFPYNSKVDFCFCTLAGELTPGPPDADGNIYFSAPLTHEIFKLNRDSVRKICEFVFPADRSINKKYLKENNIKVIDSLGRLIQNDKKMIYEINNIFFNRDNLFFRIKSMTYFMTQGSLSEQQYNFIIDTVSKKVVSLERMNPDQNCYLLPVFGNNTVLNGIKKHKENLYSVVSSLEMFAAKNKNESQSILYPPALQKYFKKENRKSNPVIVKMKLKEF